jgi:hypothetical protein
MADGTYADEDPNASIADKVINSVKKSVASVGQLVAPHSVTDTKARTDEAVSDADTASNAGATSQNTDSWNKY